MDRGEANDAHDLHWYSTRSLRDADWRRLPALVSAKLVLLRVAPGVDLHHRFDMMRARAGEQWARGQGLVTIAQPPAWESVDAELMKFKALVPQYLQG